MMSPSIFDKLPPALQERLRQLGQATDLIGRPLPLETRIANHLETVEILLNGRLTYQDLAIAFAEVGVEGGKPVPPKSLRAAVSRCRAKREAADSSNVQHKAASSNAAQPMAAPSSFKPPVAAVRNDSQLIAAGRNDLQLIAAERSFAQTIAATSSSRQRPEVSQEHPSTASARDPPGQGLADPRLADLGETAEAGILPDVRSTNPDSKARSDVGSDPLPSLPAKAGRIQISREAAQLAHRGRRHDQE